MERPLRVAILHPDLGIGGAERLVVDAALELGRVGHRATIFTLEHDAARSFPETREGRVEVRVQRSRLPAQIGGRLRAPCAIARAIWQARALLRDRSDFDVVFCDLVANGIPILRRAGVPVVFYCHFPDMLLAPRRHGVFAPYRRWIDCAEERSLAAANLVLVNSAFSRAVTRRVFPRMRARRIEIVHPGVDPQRFAEIRSRPGADAPDGRVTVVALGRYDPSKNHALVVRAFAEARSHLPAPLFRRARLVIAGGLDERLAEQRAVRASLQELTARTGLAEQIELHASPTQAALDELLAQARCLVHGTRHEPFGYAPIEAMAAGRPVLAANGAGPAETIRDGETGFLRPPTPEAFGRALASLVADPDLADRLGAAGRRRVQGEFTRDRFGRKLELLLLETAARR